MGLQLADFVRRSAHERRPQSVSPQSQVGVAYFLAIRLSARVIDFACLLGRGMADPVDATRWVLPDAEGGAASTDSFEMSIVTMSLSPSTFHSTLCIRQLPHTPVSHHGFLLPRYC